MIIANDVSDLFYVPKGQYLLNHSMGARAKVADENLDHGIGLWEQQGANAWPKWFDLLSEFRSALALMLGAHSDNICPQVGVTAGFSKILHSLKLKSTNTSIAMLRQDFPSMGFAARKAMQGCWNIDWVEEPSLDAWEAALKRRPTVALITHILYGNGQLQDVSKIITLCKLNDVFSIVDVAQSAGILPISLKYWDADAVVGSCVKWLCGGPGAGFLWINPNVTSYLEPSDVGWFSHENPFEFDIEHFEYAQHARRFMGGTPNVWPYYFALAGIKTLDKIGVNICLLHNKQWVNRCIKEAYDRGIRPISPRDAEERGGTLCLNVSNDPESVTKQLAEQAVYVDYRPGYGIRLSPHVYTAIPDSWEWLDLLK